MANERDIIGKAIAATENEIFGDAFGHEDGMILDESGDRSLEQMGEGLEGQHEPEDGDEDGDEDFDEMSGDVEAGDDETDGEDGEQPEEVTAEEDGGKKKPGTKAETDTGRQQPEGRVPPGRLREQTEKLRTAEAERDALKSQLQERDANHRKELDALNAKFDGVLAALRQQQPQQSQPQKEVVQPATVPDLFENPQAFVEHIQSGFQTELQRRDARLEEMRIETSLQVAHAKHGDAFSAAYQALTGLDQRNPENIAMGQRILKSPNPGEALVQWHKRNEVLRQVGDDPSKYRERVAEETRKALMADPEFRKQLIEDLRADASTGDNGRPRTTTRLPASLNRAAGNNNSRRGDASVLDDSDSAVFSSAFST